MFVKNAVEFIDILFCVNVNMYLLKNSTRRVFHHKAVILFPVIATPSFYLAHLSYIVYKLFLFFFELWGPHPVYYTIIVLIVQNSFLGMKTMANSLVDMVPWVKWVHFFIEPLLALILTVSSGCKSACKDGWDLYWTLNQPYTGPRSFRKFLEYEWFKNHLISTKPDFIAFDELLNAFTEF